MRLDKIRHQVKVARVVCLLAAMVIVAVGLWYNVKSFETPLEFGMNGWALHNSVWITGLGAFALITITKYGKIPCFFQDKPAWEPMPIRNGGHSEARLVANIRRYLIDFALW